MSAPEPPLTQPGGAQPPLNRPDSQGFDPQQPPAQKLLDACVHCGFCLATCPSYRVIGKETDSPRGRIYLMNGINKGEIPLTATTAQHFDSCLGCLACVTTCPSGVQYDQLIAATRPQIERNHQRPISDLALRTLIFNLFPYPQRLRSILPLLWLYQRSGLQSVLQSTGMLNRLFPRLGAMESMLPKVTAAAFRDQLPRLIPAQGERRYRVGMILGCVQRLFFSPVNAATVRVLTANGCEVVIPPDQGCCAALPAHQGQQAQAQNLARQMIDAFAQTPVDAVIINAAGCGHTLKEYGALLADDPAYQAKAKQFAAQVQDVHEFLATKDHFIASLAPIAERELTLVYQDACHLLHGQQISAAPRQLLSKIPGIRLREPRDAALCCGSAGVYSLLQPETAAELGRQKAANLLNTNPDVIASPNPGCALQISQYLRDQGKRVPLMHPIELLDYAIRGETLELV
ncbi:MAG: 4Fe-4S dicluster domain-containing protein [Acaryochloridaceae cyanobacterium CSU_5_19]|nr:4Fe-4S dicluster domain-containing protein [Acaryochloridaceae cyanobacterium CSU_5_19]